jgi:hypothetical protein
LQICPPLPSVLASVLAVLGEQQKRERGERKPTDIVATRGGDDPRSWGRVVGRAGRQVLLQVEEHK